MKKVPRKRAIDIVLAGHIQDIEEWVLRDREGLKAWLYNVLDLGRMPVSEMKEKFANYFAPYISEEDDKGWSDL